MRPFNFKTIFFTILLSLTVAFPASAEYFSDIIITSPDAIWTDSRAYSTLNEAVAAVGADERTIVIASEQTVTALIIPANVTLKFERDGAINNSGQLTINTTNIVAENRQIFSGTGDIDFATGSILKTGWFRDIESAFDLTTNDIVTLIVSRSHTITANLSLGDNIVLKWESPGNILTVSAGVTVGNLKNIEAGNYQLFAGAGDFDFVDSTRLKLSWFNCLRSALTWVEDEEVILVISDTNTIDFSDTVPSNIYLDFISEKGQFSISAGVTLTVHSPFNINALPNKQIIDGLGLISFSNPGEVYPDWWGVNAVPGTTDMSSMIESADDSLGSNYGVIRFTTGEYLVDNNVTHDLYIDIKFSFGSTLNITIGNIYTIHSPNNVVASIRQHIFDGDGNITFSYPGEVYPEWFGIIDGTSDSEYINDAITAGGIGAIVKLQPYTYYISSPILLLDNQTLISDSGNTLLYLPNLTSLGLDYGIVHIESKTGVRIEGIKIDGNYSNQVATTWHGIYFKSSTYSTINNVKVYNVRSDAGNDCADIKIYNSYKVFLLNSYLGNSNNNAILSASTYCIIDNCIFEDNVLSEAVSIFRLTGNYGDDFNTVSNCIFNNCRVGVMVYESGSNSINGLTINNYAVAGISIRSGFVTVSNVTIKMGPSTTSPAVTVGQISLIDRPILLSNIIVDFNGVSKSAFNIWESGPSKVKLVNCHAFNSGAATTANHHGFTMGDLVDSTLIGCTARDAYGQGFRLGGTSNNVSFIECSAINNGDYGLLILSGVLTHGRIVGGVYKNNSRLTPGTYEGLIVSQLNIDVYIDETVQIYDDQSSRTQKTDGLEVGVDTGNIVDIGPPAKGYWIAGQRAWKKNAAASDAPGWVCVARYDTEAKVAWAAADLQGDIDSSVGMLAGDYIGIELNSGSIHWTTIASVIDADTITITDAIPGGTSVSINNNIHVWRWKAMANLDA